jgi:hypothetical protein
MRTPKAHVLDLEPIRELGVRAFRRCLAIVAGGQRHSDSARFRSTEDIDDGQSERQEPRKALQEACIQHRFTELV